MLVKDKNGREIEITVYGRYGDDIEIDEAYYTDTDEEVGEDVIEYIYENYADEMYEEWVDHMVGIAESRYEGER